MREHGHHHAGDCGCDCEAPKVASVSVATKAHDEAEPHLCGCPVCAKASGPVRELIYVALAIVLGVSVVGYFFGLTKEAPARPQQWSREAAAAPGDVPAAVTYREMNARRRGPNANWQNHLDKIKGLSPTLLEPVQQTEGQKAEALALRASRRAYDGAPPVVPHPITQDTASSCLACHQDGLRVGDRIAPKISHRAYTNCTQCHVESDNKAFAAGPPLTDNTFIGVASPAKGERAWQGAPPTIPHSTLMRSDCMSCHGVNGLAGIRSTHPWRQSCTQCHSAGAELDQQPFPTFGDRGDAAPPVGMTE
jgi:cytochrome c-type protein NapB